MALVAGGAGGIGTATCLRLAAEGARVCVADIQERAASDIVGQITAQGGEAIAVRLDLGSAASIKQGFAAARSRYGAIDLLHCNGVRSAEGDANALEADIGIWEETLRINVTGYLLCTQEVLPDMIARKKGAIAYMASIAAYSPEDTRVGYSVSKAAVCALMRHVAHSWGRQGIRANAIAPGVTLTPTLEAFYPEDLLRQLLHTGRSPRHGRPEDIAAMVAMVLSDDGEWINGQTIQVDGGRVLRA